MPKIPTLRGLPDTRVMSEMVACGVRPNTGMRPRTSNAVAQLSQCTVREQASSTRRSLFCYAKAGPRELNCGTHGEIHSIDTLVATRPRLAAAEPVGSR